LSAMLSLGKRVNPVRLRVRAPIPFSIFDFRLVINRIASMQQAADCFCKAILPGQHRLEDPFLFPIGDFRFPI
jgi:hypothetical protein